MTETFISSTFRIPTFRAANTTARDKLWKRERKPRKRHNPPADGLSSEILKARQVWQASIKMEYRMYPKPSTRLVKVSQALGSWSWAVKADLWSGFACSLCLSFSSRDPLGSLCPGARWPARIQAYIHDPRQHKGISQCNSLYFRCCSSRSSNPSQNTEIKCWEDSVPYRTVSLNLNL